MSNVKFDFSGKNFVVTGASSGMGRQVAKELAQAGAKVLVIARRREQLIELQNEYPEHVVVASLDVCDYEAMELAIQDFVKDNGKLSGAVYAAGINGLTPLKGYDSDVCRQIMNVNFWSAVKFVQICSNLRNSERGASFVLFSSKITEKVDTGCFAYATSKAGVRIATQTFVREVSNKGMRINTVAPSWVNTEMVGEFEGLAFAEELKSKHPLGIGQPDDVSGAVLFLLSDRAKWITGTNIIIDGGFLS